MAESAEKRRTGLMFRKELPPDSGMLFVFEKEQILSFWMKNTFLPLSIAFIATNGMILEIQDMAPMDEENLHRSPLPVRYALEMEQGWFRKNGIAPGDRINGIK